MPQLSRRLRSALYIDFENFKFHAKDDKAAAVANVISWLEDGRFDGASRRKRRLVQRRLYLNCQNNDQRKSFEAIGLEVIEVEHFWGLHNSADIRISVDMMETAILTPSIDEFILFSLDADFIPLVQKLGARNKRTVMLVDESKPAMLSAVRLHADAVIAKRVLAREAETYRRPPSLLRRMFGAKAEPRTLAGEAGPEADVVDGVGAQETDTKAAAQAAAERSGPAAPPPAVKRQAQDAAAARAVATRAVPEGAKDAPEAPTPVAQPPPTLPQGAVDAFLRIASRNVGQPTARTAIMKELSSVSGFAHTGRQAYFGYKSYKALAEAVALTEGRIRVKPLSFGGISVTYLAPAGDAAPGPLSTNVPVSGPTP